MGVFRVTGLTNSTFLYINHDTWFIGSFGGVRVGLSWWSGIYGYVFSPGVVSL